MKILLFPNGPEGWQTGIEDGFSSLASNGRIVSVDWFYLADQCKKVGSQSAITAALELAQRLQPDFIVLFHVGNLPLGKEFMDKLRGLKSRPVIVYDEGDMYGSWSKPLTSAMKAVISSSDVVSVRGLGPFRQTLARFNPRIIYTPHHADIARFDREPYVLEERSKSTVLIGNRIKRSLRGRMPGASGRESFVRFMGREFPGRFALHGNGWDGFRGNLGPVDFQKQMDTYRNSWITVAYEHYPAVSHYFSNRLPIALLSGSLYVCHRHDGYDEMFKGLDFIFPFDSHGEAGDTIRHLLSMSKTELHERGLRAREHALRHYTPEIVWANFVNNSLRLCGRDEI
jgi:hypothetical protein